jgi:hypothetical protein
MADGRKLLQDETDGPLSEVFEREPLTESIAPH